MDLSRSLRWSFGLFFVLGLSACRSCSQPQRATQSAEEPSPEASPAPGTGTPSVVQDAASAQGSALAEDAAAPEAVDAAPAPPAYQPPPVEDQRRGYRTLHERLGRGLSLERAQAGIDPPLPQGVVLEYLRCLTVLRPALCNQIEPANAEVCRAEAEQIRARAQGDRGWVATPSFVSQSRRAVPQAPRNLFDRYAEAVELGDPSRCPQFRDAPSDCEAAASGDMSACERIMPQHVDACRQHAERLSLLRQGIQAVIASGRSPRAVGALGYARCWQITQLGDPPEPPPANITP